MKKFNLIKLRALFRSNTTLDNIQKLTEIAEKVVNVLPSNAIPVGNFEYILPINENPYEWDGSVSGIRVKLSLAMVNPFETKEENEHFERELDKIGGLVKEYLKED